MKIKDISKQSDQLVNIKPEDLMPLPYPYNEPGTEPPLKELTEEQKGRYDASLDGFLAIGIPKPATKEEEERMDCN